MSTREKLQRLSGGGAAPSSRETLYRLEREILGNELAGETPLSVKERLERLVATTARAVAERPRRKREPVASLEELVQGQRVENHRGEFYQVETEYPLEHWHGRMSLSRLKLVSREAFSILTRDDESSGLDLTRAVFLDAETTGLAGGAGTCAFLVGLGYVEDERFVVRQLFMRDYPEEVALLEELAEFLPRFESLVTFNGKSFDVPLLESRFVLGRLLFPLTEVPHFDLLHPARNLWKARLESCRLTDLEYALLGLEREEDVPGELIPSLYFDYVRTQDASRLYRVFNHNRYDILSLAALTIRASEMLEEGAWLDDPLDDYSLGRLFERAEVLDRSSLHYHRALEGGVGGAARRRSLRQLAQQHKRRAEWERATSLWEELAAEDGPEAIEAIEELAMHLEHRQRDFGRALECCDQALARVEEDLKLPPALRNRWREDFTRRRRRLERRKGLLR